MLISIKAVPAMFVFTPAVFFALTTIVLGVEVLTPAEVKATEE
jgi:hypothetical protein